MCRVAGLKSVFSIAVFPMTGGRQPTAMGRLIPLFSWGGFGPYTSFEGDKILNYYRGTSREWSASWGWQKGR